MMEQSTSTRFHLDLNDTWSVLSETRSLGAALSWLFVLINFCVSKPKAVQKDVRGELKRNDGSKVKKCKDEDET